MHKGYNVELGCEETVIHTPLEKFVVQAYRRAYEFSPFYRRIFRHAGLNRENVNSLQQFSEKVPLTTRSILVNEAKRKRDPTSVRTCKVAGPQMTVQVESYDYDADPLFVSMTPTDMHCLAKNMAQIWSRFGVRKGDHVLICDFGSSISTLCSSKNYAIHQKQGATDILGSVVSCNDGLPDYASRAAYIAEYTHPKLIVIRKDNLPLFVSCFKKRKQLRKSSIRVVAVTCNEDYLSKEERTAYRLGLGTDFSTIVRADNALFFSSNCEASNIHVNSKLYFVETVDLRTGRQLNSPDEIGRIVITNLFAEATPSIRYATALTGYLTRFDCESGCPSQHFILEGS